jgi:hypothetical protein
MFLGAVLLLAAASKANELLPFSEEVHADGLDFFFSAKTVALIALAVEAGIGLALLLGIRRLWLLIPTALLVVFFLFLNTRSYWLVAHGLRKETASCGCFGSLIARTPGQAVWQDLLLLAPPLLLAFWGREARGRAFPRLRVALAAAAAVAVVVFSVKTSDLRLIDAATHTKPMASGEFRLVENYVLFVDGKPSLKAEIYQSEMSVAFLIIVPEIAPAILIRPRTSTVQTVDRDQIIKLQKGVDLRTESAPKPQGEFRIVKDAIVFKVGAHELQLKNKSAMQ